MAEEAAVFRRVLVGLALGFFSAPGVKARPRPPRCFVEFGNPLERLSGSDEAAVVA